MQDCCEIVGVLKAPVGDEIRQQVVDVVVVGLCASKLGGEGAECVRGDDAVSLVLREGSGADQPGPAVVLGDCCDGFVLRGELRDAAPPFVFVRGGLGRVLACLPGGGAGLLVVGRVSGTVHVLGG